MVLCVTGYLWRGLEGHRAGPTCGVTTGAMGHPHRADLVAGINTTHELPCDQHLYTLLYID